MAARADITAAQLAAITGGQLLAAGAVAGVEVAVTGGLGLLFPLSALFVGAFFAFWGLGARREGWPQRATIQRAALISAGNIWALGTALYAAAFLLQPDAFAFSAPMLILFAPAVGLLPGLASLVLTMCAGDAAATTLGSYDELRIASARFHEDDEFEEDGSPVDLYERFSARTRRRDPRRGRR